MAYFSFRAECAADVDRFQRECAQDGVVATFRQVPDKDGLPDVDVEITSHAKLADLRAVLRRLIDAHVMLETLRECPLAENSLKRDRTFL
jgi:hypothetical protein